MVSSVGCHEVASSSEKTAESRTRSQSWLLARPYFTNGGAWPHGQPTAGRKIWVRNGLGLYLCHCRGWMRLFGHGKGGAPVQLPMPMTKAGGKPSCPLSFCGGRAFKLRTWAACRCACRGQHLKAERTDSFLLHDMQLSGSQKFQMCRPERA